MITSLGVEVKVQKFDLIVIGSGLALMLQMHTKRSLLNFNEKFLLVISSLSGLFEVVALPAVA